MENKKLTDLLKQMTFEEKVGQLTQLAGYLYDQANSDLTGPLKENKILLFLNATAGSVVGSSGAKITKQIQREHLEKSRLKIPLLLTADIIHGYRTIFPIPLAISSSWNLDLAKKSARVAAREAAAAGIHATLAPMVDVVRDPRWGRVVESAGEDPYLNSVFAQAYISGYRGEDLRNDHSSIATCLKHFAAYGEVDGGREYNHVDVSEVDLKNIFLPPFEAGIEAGAEMVMASFTPFNGIPASGNKKLLKEILREGLGFNGVIISDWNSVGELINHGVAENNYEAAKKAMEATLDIEMMTFAYAEALKELVENGEIEEEAIDQSVLRVLELKDQLGLFENPYRGADEELEAEISFSKEHLQVAEEVANESIVLLKNEQVLPLTPSQKVAYIGPFIDESNVLGTWSWKGEEEEAIQLKDALLAKVPVDQLLFARGCELFEASDESWREALDAAKEADVIVLALGEHAKMSGEASSRSQIKLPDIQLSLIKEMSKLNKPIVTCLFNGRPIELAGIIDQSDALVETWYLGSASGKAIANVLYGDVNPSGKTTMSFPINAGQIPVHYNHYKTGRPYDPDIKTDNKWVSRYLDIPNAPAIPFGFGLSYTNFEYSELEVSDNTFTKDKPLHVSVQVKNTGMRSGKEIVQFYVQDLVGEIVRPVKELKGFEKISLAPQESKTVQFTLDEEMVRYYHSDMTYKSDAGKFKLFVGPSSVEGKSILVELEKDSKER